MQLVCEGLARVLALHSENVLEGLLLAAQNLDLLLVSVEVLMELATSLCEVAQLALEVCRVL